MYGKYTKQQEIKITIELFESIYKNKGLYFAIALLYDLQYTNKDLRLMMDELEPQAKQSLKNAKFLSDLGLTVEDYLNK